MLVSESETAASGNVKSEALQQPQLAQAESLKDNSVSALNKQNSVFSLTLDEFQLKSGKCFGSMNMDEFLANIWSVEENQSQPIQNEPANNKSLAIQPTLARQGSLSIPIPLCNKTVDEVWLEIHKDQPQQEKPNNIGNHDAPQRQQTFGEMTLEDFLIKAGVVQGSLESTQKKMATPVRDQHDNFPTNNACLDTNIGMGHVMGLGFTNHQNAANNLPGNGFAAYSMFTQSNRFAGEPSSGAEIDQCHSLVDSGVQKNRKRIIDGPPEVVVERRQRRMIKNRESAARSRARKQAYTVELELELDHLKEENEKLKQTVAEMEEQRKQEEMKRKQSSTKAQKKTEKLRTIRRTVSLAW